MEVLLIFGLEHVGIPVVAAGADADDTALAVLGRVLPGHDSAVAAHTQNLAASAGLPGCVVVIAAPVGTDVVLGRRVGDVVAVVGAIDLVRIVAGDEACIERMLVLATKDIEVPRTPAALGAVFVLAPAVVRGGPLVVTGCADEGRKVGRVAGEQEGTAVLVVGAELVHGFQGIRSLGDKVVVTVYTAVHVEVPPDDLALIQLNRAGLEVGEAGVQGAGHIGKHPFTGSLGFGIQLVHVGGSADEQGLGLVDGNHIHRVHALGGVVGHGVLYGLGEVLRYAGKRSNGGVLADNDGRNQCVDAFRLGYEGLDGLVLLVDGTGINVVQNKVQDAGFVVQDAQRPVDRGISVGYMDAFGGVHIQYLALGDVAGRVLGQGEFRDGHLGSGVDFRKTYHNGAGGQIYNSGEIVQRDGLNQAVAAQFEVAHGFLGAAGKAKQGSCNIE